MMDGLVGFDFIMFDWIFFRVLVRVFFLYRDEFIVKYWGLEMFFRYGMKNKLW